MFDKGGALALGLCEVEECPHTGHGEADEKARDEEKDASTKLVNGGDSDKVSNHHHRRHGDRAQTRINTAAAALRKVSLQ